MENTNKMYYCITKENIQDLIDYIKSNYDKYRKLYCQFYENKNEENLSILLHGIKDYNDKYLADTLCSIVVSSLYTSDIMIIDKSFHRGIEEIVHSIHLKHYLETDKIDIDRVIAIQFRSEHKNIVTILIKHEFIDDEYKVYFYIYLEYTDNEASVPVYSSYVKTDKYKIDKYDKIYIRNIEDIIGYIKDNYKSDETDYVKKTIKMLHCVKDYIDKYLNLDITSITITSPPKEQIPNGLKIVEHDFDKAIDTLFEGFDNCITSSIYFKSGNSFIVIIVIEDHVIPKTSKHATSIDILPMDDFNKYVTIEVE